LDFRYGVVSNTFSTEAEAAAPWGVQEGGVELYLFDYPSKAMIQPVMERAVPRLMEQPAQRFSL
jgi:hypothetical protein